MKKNKFEINNADELNLKKFMEDKEDSEEDEQTNDPSFEILNDKILYRQEVIGQSMCGLKIYQITITKRKENSIKFRKK